MIALHTYRSLVASVALKSISGAATNLDWLKQLLIHLDDDAVQQLAGRTEGEGRVRCALPPTACTWAHPVLVLERRGEEILASVPLFTSFESRFAAEDSAALHFARRHWGGALVTEQPAQTIAVRLERPLGKEPDTRAVDETVMALGLARPLATIWNTCPDAFAFHRAFEQSIIFIHNGYAACRELIGLRAFEEESFCAACGCALEIDACRGCGVTFNDNGAMSSARGVLPRTLVEAYRSIGHVFNNEALEAAYEALAA